MVHQYQRDRDALVGLVGRMEGFAHDMALRRDDRDRD